jgi:hypothetical protein
LMNAQHADAGAVGGIKPSRPDVCWGHFPPQQPAEAALPPVGP